MADPNLKAAQDVFKLIVLHNKLMPEKDLDFFLQESPDPDIAIQRIVASNYIDPVVAKKVMSVYRKKLEKVASEGGLVAASAPASPAAPAASPRPAAAAPAAPAQPRTAAPAQPADDDDDEIPAGAIPVEGFEVQGKKKPAGPSVAMVQGSDRVGPRVEIGEGGKKFIHRLLQTARELRASDIYIKSNSPSVIRLNGALRYLDMDPVPAELCEKSLCSILNETQNKTFRTTSDVDFCYDGGEGLGRFRANFFRQFTGVDGVFRLIAQKPPSFEELGLPEVIRKLTQYRVGMVLITGPKSSGKTTTLAAMVDLINSTRREHVITVEDPIEFVHPCKMGHINQREVGPHTQSFANALRAALREAPDIIMVGEMRDLETTSLAITASETGHLVLSTLHTPDAARTIGRVLDVFPPSEQPQIRAMVSESLRGVVSQQLIPSFDGKGVVLAQEIMINTPAIANLIRENRTFQLASSIQTGKKLGMVLMDESLIQLAKQRRIRPEDAVSRAANVNLVRKELGLTAEAAPTPH